MTSQTPQPAFFGTPEQWWEQAEPITEDEAANRHLGTWYISADTNRGEPTGSFRLAQPTLASNATRVDALNRRMYLNETTPDSIAPNVRALLRVPVEREPWMDGDLVVADSAKGSTERVAWRRTKAGQWRQVFEANKSAGERAMAELNPVVATINELTSKGP